MDKFTLIIPYYRQPTMLAYQLQALECYPPGFQFIVVDDGSPEQAIDVIQQENVSDELLKRLRLYRITKDVPWNRGMARNLGAKEATTDWIIHVDIDHVLIGGNADKLLYTSELEAGNWYRFPRHRHGTADDTRKKDKIPNDKVYGEIHPHIDSYVIERSLYWGVGGYDEDYSGCLGGGTVFLRQLSALVKPKLLPADVYLTVVTRSIVQDSSISTLDRSHTEFRRRQMDKTRRGDVTPKNPLRQPWERVL